MTRYSQFNKSIVPNKTYSMVKAVLMALGIVLLLALVIDYVSLPAYNIHDMGFLGLLIMYFGLFGFLIYFFSGKLTIISYASFVVALSIVGFIVVFSILGSEILNADRFQQQLNITEKTSFTDEFDLDKNYIIPYIDEETARQLGDKQIGKVQGLGSQYNININYTLVSVLDKVYRISPLEYQDIYKWWQNKNNGIPGYIKVNVQDFNDASIVSLTKGMKYSPSAFFDQDLLRHVRFKYRTAILDDFSFEIDDAGHPYYVISVIEPKIGFFSGWDATAVIVVDAVNGDMNRYPLDAIPDWIDRVQPVKLAWFQVDNWGYYVHGWWNTIFGQKDVLQTTSGYNYVSIKGETYVYSGMTSVGSDRSIVGFSLINLRTKAATFYKIGGADESSAMSSAQGQVQHLGYQATFPVLVRISNEASYFMSLKDQEGLIKMFAIVNVSDYSIVGVGTTLAEVKADYNAKLIEAGIIEGSNADTISLTATVKSITQSIINGQSRYYIQLNESSVLFYVDLSLNAEIALTKAGDPIVIEYLKSEDKILPVLTFDNTALAY